MSEGYIFEWSPDLAYATLDNLTAYLGYNPPERSERALMSAKRLLDSLPQISWLQDPYRVTRMGNIYPTETQIRDGLQLATCMQVEYWIELGDGEVDESHDIRRLQEPGVLAGEKIPAHPILAPRAHDILIQYGLWQSGPETRHYSPAGYRTYGW